MKFNYIRGLHIHSILSLLWLEVLSQITFIYIILCKEPTRCNFGSIVY